MRLASVVLPIAWVPICALALYGATIGWWDGWPWNDPVLAVFYLLWLAWLDLVLRDRRQR